MRRGDLERLSKDELIELVRKLQRPAAHRAARERVGNQGVHDGAPSLGRSGFPSRSATFLDIDDGFRPLEASQKPCVLGHCAGQLGRQRVDAGRLGAAP